jgi:hypothetical protein
MRRYHYSTFGMMMSRLKVELLNFRVIMSYLKASLHHVVVIMSYLNIPLKHLGVPMSYLKFHHRIQEQSWHESTITAFAFREVMTQPSQ